MESSIFVSVTMKWVFWHFEFIFLPNDNGLFQTQLLNFIQTAKTPLVLGLRQKWMIPSCCLWKVVTFFGKEHVNWSSISGVMIRRSWTIKFGKVHYLFDKIINSKCQNNPFIGTKTKMDDSILLLVKSSYFFW